MLNLIAEQVPQEVYVIMTTFAPNTRHYGYDARDQVKTEMVGIFDTLEQANRAAEAFLEQRIKPFVLTPGPPYDPMQSTRTQTRRLADGTMWYSVTEIRGDHTSIVQTFKETVRNHMWSKEEMPLPPHCYRKHDSKCLCCNTADELEAVKKAEEELEVQTLLRNKERRMINVSEQLTRISRELEELKKDTSLDAVNLEDDTEDEDEDYEMQDDLDIFGDDDDAV